jgi:superfamily I DNA and RNA helicase
VTTSAWLMLQRNLLYTAVTRAKQMVVLVGSRRALAKAVRRLPYHSSRWATGSLDQPCGRVHRMRR